MALTKKAKVWIIGGSAAAVVAVVAIVLLVISLTTVTKEDYTAATATTTDIAKQSDAYGAALAAYGSGIAKEESNDTLKPLASSASTTLDELLASQDKLGKSAVLRDVQVKSAYDAYNKKAQAFKEAATGYRTSMPLFVTMYATCHEAFKTANPSENIFAALDQFVQETMDIANGGITKQEALDRFDAKGKDCLPAATALQKSGTNTYAKMGDLVVNTYNNTRNGIIAKYDDPHYDATAARMKQDADNQQRFKDIEASQKKEAEATDFTAELKTLNQLLTDKAVKKN